jgi:predicted acetyltransferase
MTAAYPIRAISADEFRAYCAVIEHAFNGGPPTDAEIQHDLATAEFDRSLAAFDGADIVGTAAAITFEMTVPGDVAAVAGVTAVSVLPTHRRRGILSSLMRRQLSDIRDRGETVAALFASESPIYGRFGYGAASAELEFRIQRGEGAMKEQWAGPGRQAAAPRLRSAEPRDVKAELARVYDSVLRGRPGTPARDDRWWDRALWDPEQRRSGSGPMRCVIAEDDTGPCGYALFSVKPEWGEHGIPASVLSIRELLAADPRAYAAVWGDLLTRDLVAEVRARMRPADDPLLYLLADSRRTRAHLTDGLWVRLVSVPGALTRRRYACPVDVVIDVADELLAENGGRWRLRTVEPSTAADPAGPVAGLSARCERTSAAADVALPVRALGAAYLGGTRLGALAGAGLVTEIRSGALAALSAALSWDPAPWCPANF